MRPDIRLFGEATNRFGPPCIRWTASESSVLLANIQSSIAGSIDVTVSKKTVFIHIGAGKTGTTAIQNCLLANANKLARNGILFPNSDYFMRGTPNPDGAPLRCGNSIRLLYYLTGYADNSWFDKELFHSELSKAIANHRFVVFSCEYLQYTEAGRLPGLIEFCQSRGANLELIYFVRNYASHAFSTWRQLIIYHGEVLNWSQFLRRYVEDTSINTFATSIRKFSEKFDKSKMKILNYSNQPKNVVKRFFELLGENYNDYTPATEDNVSDSDLVIDAMLEFNKLVGAEFNPSTSRLAYDEIRKLNNTTWATRSKVLLSRTEYRQFAESLDAQVKFLNANFLGSDPICAAGPEQISGRGRQAYGYVARSLARTTAARFASGIPSLRSRQRPIRGALQRLGDFIATKSLERMLS